MKYQPISEVELKYRLSKGLGISGYEIDWLLSIDFSEIKMNYHGQLRFAHCHFTFGVNIFHLKGIGEYFNLVFDHCVFDHTGLNVRFLELTQIKIENCTSTQIGVSDSKIDRIDVRNTECTESCGLYDIECGKFSLTHEKECKFELVHLNSPKLEFAIIRGVREIERVLIKDAKEVWLRGKIGTVDLTEKFKRIEIQDVWDEPTKKLVNSRIKKLSFDFETFHGDILIRDTHIENLNFEELNAPTAKVQFKEVVIDNTKIVNCSIPNMIWNQLEFKNPPDLTGTDFSGLKMSNVKWPKNKALHKRLLDVDIFLLYQWRTKKKRDSVKMKISDLRYQRDTYRQLKAASIENHNKIESLEFYKNEMILYWKEIRLAGGVPWHDRVLVFVNRWVSNFGQSWHMPFLWLLFFHFVFYSCIISWNYFSNTLNYSEELGQYFYLINPAHRTPEYITSGWGQITEFFMRVFAGFFIFHFIKASRKFGKV